MKRWSLAFVYVLILTLLIRPVGAISAQQSDNLARNLKQLGDAALAEGHYQKALDAYTSAIAIEETPELHYNRGRALQALSRYAEALAELEIFERSADAALKLRVPGLDTMMAAARGEVETVSISANISNVVVKLNGGHTSELPLSDLTPVSRPRSTRGFAPRLHSRPATTSRTW